MVITALKKTAEIKKEQYPTSAKTIIENSYMDDIVDSCTNQNVARQTTKEVNTILSFGGFQVKRWFISGVKEQSEDHNANRKPLFIQGTDILQNDSLQRVLGMNWETDTDNIIFESSCSNNPPNGMQPSQISPTISAQLTKRFILSKVNSLYDPLGLLSPFTVRAKILLRKLWAIQYPALDCDDLIPSHYHEEWSNFFDGTTRVHELKFRRCLKPIGAIGLPTLVIFSDGSGVAYGAVCYARWKCQDGTFQSTLICSKNRLAPIKVIDTVRLELLGAVISKRLRSFINKHMRYKFDKTYHIVDSEIVKAMINKGSYGFNTFAANRIGEIQDTTSSSEWFWIPGKMNISDWITRGKEVTDLNTDSIWQQGPDFLKLPEQEWPIKSQTDVADLPERISSVFQVAAMIEETLASRIKIERFSSLNKLL